MNMNDKKSKDRGSDHLLVIVAMIRNDNYSVSDRLREPEKSEEKTMGVSGCRPER